MIDKHLRKSHFPLRSRRSVLCGGFAILSVVVTGFFVSLWRWYSGASISPEFISKIGSSSESVSSSRCGGVKLARPEAAVTSPGGTWEPQPLLQGREPKFPRYHGLSKLYSTTSRKKLRPPSVPTWIVTNGSVSSTIRFYDTSPFSPSGRFLALLRFPDGAEGQEVQVRAKPGSDPLLPAQVVVVDLVNGLEKVVSITRGWDSQTGAHLQWGRTDLELVFNDVVLPSQLDWEDGVEASRGQKGGVFAAASARKLNKAEKQPQQQPQYSPQEGQGADEGRGGGVQENVNGFGAGGESEDNGALFSLEKNVSTQGMMVEWESVGSASNSKPFGSPLSELPRDPDLLPPPPPPPPVVLAETKDGGKRGRGGGGGGGGGGFSGFVPEHSMEQPPRPDLGELDSQATKRAINSSPSPVPSPLSSTSTTARPYGEAEALLRPTPLEARPGAGGRVQHAPSSFHSFDTATPFPEHLEQLQESRGEEEEEEEELAGTGVEEEVGEHLTFHADAADFLRARQRRRRDRSRRTLRSTGGGGLSSVEEREGAGPRRGGNGNKKAAEVEEEVEVMEEARAVGVVLDPFTGVRKYTQCTVYQVSPDGRFAISPCLRRMQRTQRGYGVHVPGVPVPVNTRAEASDGLYLTELETGRCRLLVSFAAIADACGLDSSLPFYGFHAKFNRQQTHIMFVVRTRKAPPAPPKKKSSTWGSGSRSSTATSVKREHPANANHVIVMDVNGTSIHRVVTWSYSHREGSHPTWHPNGHEVVMNLQHPNKRGPWSVVACPTKFSPSKAAVERAAARDAALQRARAEANQAQSELDAALESLNAARERVAKESGDFAGEPASLTTTPAQDLSHAKASVARARDRLWKARVATAEASPETKSKRRALSEEPAGSALSEGEHEGEEEGDGEEAEWGGATRRRGERARQLKGDEIADLPPVVADLGLSGKTSASGGSYFDARPSARSDLDGVSACRYVAECGSGHPSVVALKALPSQPVSGRDSGGGGGDWLKTGAEPEWRVPSELDGTRGSDTGLVVTDAYPKECGVFRGLVRPGAVPLRLVTPPPHGLPPPPEGPASAEVELLQVMSTPDPSIGDRFGGTDPRSRAGMAWRCDLHPAFDRHFRWVAFNGRPSGARRQVLVSYLGDPSRLQLLAAPQKNS